MPKEVKKMEASGLDELDGLDDMFIAESGEMLTDASCALLEAENCEDTRDLINRVFRAVHSVKGGAQTLEMNILAELAHKVEDVLMPLRQNAEHVALESALVSLLLNWMLTGVIRTLVKQAKNSSKCWIAWNASSPSPKKNPT